MAEKMAGGKMGGGSKSSGGSPKGISTPDIMTPVMPRVLRRDPVEKEEREQQWQALQRWALEAEGERIWRRPNRQR